MCPKVMTKIMEFMLRLCECSGAGFGVCWCKCIIRFVRCDFRSLCVCKISHEWSVGLLIPQEEYWRIRRIIQSPKRSLQKYLLVTETPNRRSRKYGY